METVTNSKMASYGDRQFIYSLQKPLEHRTQKDLDIIYSYLHGMEALASLREPALRALCRTVRYDFHEANDILYCQGELSTCWFILLSGSVFIEGSMFLPRSSFGRRISGCSRRPSECLILEPSEMIVVDYPDVQMMKPGPGPQRLTLPPPSPVPPAPPSGVMAGGNTSMNLDHLNSLEQEDTNMRVHRMHSDVSSEQYTYPNDMPLMYQRDAFIRDHCTKRNSRASDTSSAYSGSDLMQSSLDDPDNGDIDLSGLVESMVDSDEEEGYAESTESARDAVRECLEKDTSERTDDDIEILLDSMQHFPAFANMTLAIRRALCSVMVFAVVEKASTIVMNDGEELDSWSVILSGVVEITYADGVHHLHMGDSFGITPTMEKLYHQGVMRTLEDECQFVCITQSDYYRILHQGEENIRKIEEKGDVVMVTEHRELDGGNRRGHITIRGTRERLMQHLVEDHSVIDPTYVEDFLLTYRTFLASPALLAEKLLQWFNDPMLRSKVTRVVLLWVNNHFNDFETDANMCDFLEKFEQLLERERMGGQLRLLNIACAAKARPRTVTLTRATREEIMHFSILGGMERSSGIFVSKVEKLSKAYEASLKRGDQILEVNGVNFENISHTRALEVLRGTTHLAITVKSNILAFKEMLEVPDRTGGRKCKKDEIAKLQTDPKQRLSAPDLEIPLPPVITVTKDKKNDKKDRGFMSLGHRTRLRKALMKINIIPKSLNPDTSLYSSDENLHARPSRKSSTSSSSSSNTSGLLSNHLSASNPDLSMASSIDDSRNDFPEHVLKIFRSDQTFKYLLIHKETTAREVVMLALREFGITEPSSNYSLCEVIVENENFVKQKRLPDQLCNLPERISLNGRYYLKNNMSTETLVPDELTAELVKEHQTSLILLNSAEVASQLTLSDFRVFRDIEQTEYVDDLFDIESAYGVPNLARFEQSVNHEMFWVVTEVCGEPNIVKRMKILKHFIKIARHCKDCKNFNSMFAILSGLGHGSVSRLRNTWEKLPQKYIKMFDDLQEYMDPSRNMSKYRQLINCDHTQPPMLPLFPVVKKDLTFIHIGNDSIVNGLVNFEKLRMIAKEIRHVCNMCSAKYNVSTMYLGTPSYYESATISGVATLKRTKNRRGSAMPNGKKMYEESQMVRRVKAYLINTHAITDEEELEKMSFKCEPPARKRDPSPMVSGGIAHGGSLEKVITGPKFGSASAESVRKLMALTDKVRPHNPKYPLPPASSTSAFFGGLRRPNSPRLSRALAVRLSPESSSVVSLGNLGLRKPLRTASVGSSESASPTSSIHSCPAQYETDSGHNSITSSNYDSRSTSSVGSGANSPPLAKRLLHPNQTVTYNASNPLSSLPPQPQSRPPLPPYHVVIQNMAATNEKATFRRPPLPDYHSATQMAQLARQKQQQQQQQQQHQVYSNGAAHWPMERAHSHEGVIGYYHTDDVSYDVVEEEEQEEEQVSAV